MSETVLDTKGLVCPLPVLRARKALKAMQPGDVIRIEATDPAAVHDFRTYCQTTGDALLESTQNGAIYQFVIRKV